MTGLLTWITNYGSIVGFFIQIAFYIILAVSALWATLLFKRFVDFRVGTPAAPVESSETAKAEEAPSVDDFVD